jgi:hypothetical protein
LHRTIGNNHRILLTMHPNIFPSDFLLPEWIATQGGGVKIALLDTGCILSHPGLQHLQVPGRCFDTTIPGFDPATATGQDDITELPYRNVYHGTQSAGLLAGAADTDKGVAGLVPNAELYLIKIRDAAQETYIDYFMHAIALCLRLDVDLVVCPYAPVFREPYNRDLLQHLMAELHQRNIAVFATKPNTTLLQRLNAPDFPANQAAAINTVVLNPDLLSNILTVNDLAADLHLLAPAINITCFTHPDLGGYVRRTLKNSHITVLTAGVAALLLAHNRAQGAAARLAQTEVIEKLSRAAPSFDPVALQQANGLRLYKR